DVLEVLQPDAALVALSHLPHVVLEASERPDAPLVHDDTVADETGTRTARDRSRRDVAAGNHAHPRPAERRADLRAADLRLQLSRSEEAGKRLTHVVDRLVDHAVEAEVDALLVGHLLRLLIGADVEPDHDRPRGHREIHVALGDRAHAGVDHADPYLVLRELLERVDERTERTLHVRLDHEIELRRLRVT